MPRGVLEHNGQKYFDSIKEVFGQYIDARPLYVHVWQEGDLLIWDNLSVMHRSMGGYKGRRLLHRTQAFYCSLD
jgi:alpha-ketoglutarate-dependent taurine dioxygenase